MMPPLAGGVQVTIQNEAGTIRPTRLISVLVSFPVSRKGPYRAQFPPDTTTGTVRQDAMEHFEVSDTSEYTYVLTHDGQDVPDDRTIKQVAGEKDSVEFRLVKILPQG
jgi:hypothetical protein